ncbi:hypothetical protein [Blastomonas sp. AAP53]|uniref:hypothetical protein n=1 Tax=Blastomonas sp. AAP53 TaxID=1248760 RepID=UPI0002E9C23E|nr:hypothetical protein [Blastomonas sp. AAP53]
MPANRRLIAAGLFATGAALFALQPLALAQGDAPAAKKSRVPPAEVVGEPVSCINLSQIRSSEVRDDRTIDFVMSGGRVYRNELPQQCGSLGFDRAFTYSTSLTQLCNVDIITVLQNVGGGFNRGASCGLGEFTPVKLIKQTKGG